MACLDVSKHANWTSTQEKTISRDFPFADLHAEAADQYVVRTYLQFLWLPDSIMPVRLLVPALLRASPTPALIEPLLLTPRSAANKYHVELPQILADGSGAGEIEECMMWFALNYEKPDEGEGPWEDGAWRQRWLERLERREVQIQILLHLLMVFLAGAHRPDAPSPPPKKRKRDAPAPPSLEEHLESFMDKLSMWQLVERLDADRHSPPGNADGRDWMQAFCEDIVERHFISKLPEACALLRMKVFPNSPFSDDDTSSSPSRSASPDQASRHPSPALPSASGVPLTLTKLPEIPEAARTSRSRSLSITLALDADARTAGAGAKKRVLNREVSMSRVFKGKAPEKRAAETKRVSGKEGTAHNAGGSRGKISRVDTGKTLVAATPVKARIQSRAQEEEIWML